MAAVAVSARARLDHGSMERHEGEDGDLAPEDSTVLRRGRRAAPGLAVQFVKEEMRELHPRVPVHFDWGVLKRNR